MKSYRVKEFLSIPKIGAGPKLDLPHFSFLPAGLLAMAPVVKGAYIAIIGIGAVALSAVIVEKLLDKRGYFGYSKAVGVIFKGVLIIAGSTYILWALTNNAFYVWGTRP